MSLNKTGNYVNGLNTILNTFNSTGSSEAIEIFKGLNAETQKWILSSGKLSEVQIGMIKGGMNFKESTDSVKKSISGLTLEEFENAVATGGISTSQTAATGSTSSLGLAFQGLAAKIGISTTALGVFIGAVAAIGVGIAAFNAYQQHLENVRQATQEAADTYKDASSSVDDYVSRYSELKQALEDARGNEEETYNVKKQLLALQTELNDKFGEEYGKINLVTDAYNDQTEAIKTYNKEAAQTFLNENYSGINRAETEINKNRQFNLGGKENLNSNKAWEEIKKIAEAYEDRGIHIIDDGYGSLSIQLSADATSATETIDAFMTDVQNKANELGDEDMFAGILSISETAMSNAKEVIEKYGDIYKQALTAEIVSDDEKAKKYNEALNAVEAYNDAVLKSEDPYNDENVTKARQDLETIKSEIQDNQDEWGKYSSLTDDIFEQADTKLLDFNDDLKTNKDLIEAATQLEGYDATDLGAFADTGENEAFNKLKASAEAYGLEVDDLINALVRLGYVQGDIETQASNTDYSIETLTTSYKDLNTEIDTVNSALSEQSTGQSISLDTYEELIALNEDYADALEYVNGAMQLNADKVKEITKAKAEETIATNEAAKAQKQMDYLANAKEIETLTQKLKAKNFTGEETAETVQAQIDAFKTENDTIVSTCKQIDLMNTSLRQSIGTYQAWKDAQNAPQSGDMFDDALTAMDDIWDIWDEESENFMKVGNDTYKTAVEFLIPDTVDHQDMEAVKEYMRSIKKYLTWDDDGNQDGLDLGEFIQASVDEGLMYLDETSNQYMVAGQKTMEDFATGLGLSLPFVQAIFGELEEYGAEFDWGDEVYENTGDAIVSVNEQIQNLEDSLAYLEEQKAAGVKIDDSYILELQEQLKEAIMLRDDLCEEATTKVTSNIEIKEQLSQAREELASWQSQLEQDPTNVEIQAHVDESQEKVKSLEQDLETIGEPTTVEINVAKENIDKEIEETQTKIDQLSDKEYLAKIGISEEHADYSIGKLQEKLDELETEKGKIVAVYGDTSEAQTDIDNINEETIDDKEFNVIANIDDAKSRIAQIKYALSTIQDKTVTVTTTYSEEGRVGLNGTAHLSGTANASGNWGTKTGGTALVGELGPEIIVESRTGRWYTVGDNGAEFVNIPKNSIVFNHLQTEELLKNGYVSSRAMAFARGTAYASGTAMVTGGGLSASIVRTQSATKGTSTSSKREKESAAVAENTRKAAEAAEEFNEQIDWMETNLERINTLLGWAKDDIDEIGKSGGFESRIADIEKALSYANSYKDAAYKAGNVYQTYADSLGLANEYVEKIKNGTMAIETITDETLKDQISRYQDWYEKAIDCFNVVRDMNEEIKSLQLQKLDAVETWADSRINYQEALANRMQAYIDLADTKGIGNTENQLNYMVDRQVTIRGKLNTELTNLKTQFRNLMNNGTIQKYSDEWHEWMAKIYDVETAITETETAVEELQNEINDLRWEKFERGITVIENASEELSDLIKS